MPEDEDTSFSSLVEDLPDKIATKDMIKRV